MESLRLDGTRDDLEEHGMREEQLSISGTKGLSMGVSLPIVSEMVETHNETPTAAFSL
jgi:hypothetical protein